MPPGTRANSDKNDESNSVVTFIKSAEFGDIIRNIVNNEMRNLQEQVADLINEVTMLRQSNVELTQLLTSKEYAQSKSLIHNNTESESRTTKSKISYADKAISRPSEQKRSSQKIPSTAKEKSVLETNIKTTSNIITQNLRNIKEIKQDTESSTSDKWISVVNKKKTND
ncbi:hypothetical protein QE152_g22713 [Popillia japonica]|uniref:Uncharacterized protein n=1 Tax=Popillia japonica TaxID=7064 RepID=A0AAW1KJW5_POPJA